MGHVDRTHALHDGIGMDIGNLPLVFYWEIYRKLRQKHDFYGKYPR